jgi:RNA polymerase sigma factor for flagellar operon FliA
MHSSSARKSPKREQLILDHMPQVRILAVRIHRRCPSSVAIEDLVSAGTIGLIQAADRFDHRRNVRFPTLADHRIRGAMLDYLRDLDPMPRATRRFMRDRDCAIARLKQANDAPSDSEIANLLGISIGTYRRQARIASAGSVLSYERIDGSSGVDQIPDRDAPTPFCGALRRVLIDAVVTLPGRERFVIMSILAGYAMNEIARLLHVTPSRISQLKHRAMIRLQIAMGARTEERAA